jgi:hypothetical protein
VGERTGCTINCSRSSSEIPAARPGRADRRRRKAAQVHLGWNAQPMDEMLSAARSELIFWAAAV